MNRFVRTAAAAAIAVSGVGAVGCMSSNGPREAHEGGSHYRNWVDPCYPERYNAVARQEVVAPFAAQVNNGHFLNQTIWNWYFEPGTDKLTPAGLAKLDSIAQERPAPDAKLYLQAARDVRPTPETQDKLGAIREDLTAKRAAAVQKYMASQPSINPVAYEIYVHDAPVPGIPAEFAANAYRSQGAGYSGNLRGSGPTAPLGTGTGNMPGISAVPAGGGNQGGGNQGGGNQGGQRGGL